ncbi:MAG: hypothetical protein V3V20_08730 [Algisphaera sp.]
MNDTTNDIAPRRPLLTHGSLIVLIVSVAYLVGSAWVARRAGNNEFLFYTVTCVVIALGVAAVHWRVRFSTPLLVMLSLWGALHMAGGLMPVPESWPISGDQRVLYSWWIWPDGNGSGYFKYDHLVHSLGFGVTTWACWQALRVGLKDRRPSLGNVVLCAAAGLGFGAFNEILEFIATLMGPTNVGGYVNTSWDLVANFAGATIAATAIYAFDRKG